MESYTARSSTDENSASAPNEEREPRFSRPVAVTQSTTSSINAFTPMVSGTASYYGSTLKKGTEENSRTNEAQSQTLGLPPPQRTGLFNGRGYVARMDSEGKRKIKMKKCFFILVPLSVMIMLVGVTCPVLIEKFKCQGEHTTRIVHPEDTVLAAILDQCQGNISLTPAKQTRNVIDVYITDCNNVQVHSEEPPEFNSPPYYDVDNAISIIEESHMTSNYFVNGTVAEITAFIVSHNSTTSAFLCFFNNKDYFDIFKFPKNASHFLGVIKLGWCDQLDGEYVTHSMTFKVNTSGYYFAAIGSLGKLDTLQYNLSLTRLFYNNSDFINDQVFCPLVHGSSPCVVNNGIYNYSRTCIMLHAASSDVNYFNYISIEASPIPAVQSPIFQPVLIPCVIVCFLIAILCVLCVCKNPCKWQALS